MGVRSLSKNQMLLSKVTSFIEKAGSDGSWRNLRLRDMFKDYVEITLATLGFKPATFSLGTQSPNALLSHTPVLK